MIPALYANIPDFYANMFLPSATIGCPCFWTWERAWCVNEGERDKSRGCKKMFVDVQKTFWYVIYCVNPRPNDGYQLGFWSPRGLRILDPWIICEYKLATAIVFWTLTQICMCKMGSYIFATMSELKFTSTTRDPLPIITPKEWMNGEKCFCFSWQWLPCLYFFISPHQARSNTIGSNF